MENPIVSESMEVESMRVRGYREWAAFGHFIAELHEIMAWYLKVTLISQAVRHNGEDYTLVITAVIKKKKHVAFFNAATPVLCYTALYRAIYYGRVNWVLSKF